MQTTLNASAGTSRPAHIARDIALVLGGTLALAISSKAQIPFWPVPMTLQTLVVLLIGATFGFKRAGITILAYMMEGALGLPVFSTGAGLAYLTGPTGGYIFGFLAAALVTGYARDRGLMGRIAPAFALFLLADALILGLGCGWLAVHVGFGKAMALGLVPFLQAEALKIALATATMGAMTRSQG